MSTQGSSAWRWRRPGMLSRPWTIAVGAPLFLAGTVARYDEFTRRVPSLLPRLRP